ncbi:MAG: DUF4832 domain-containing protein [Ignavibacteriae bacterium]|nr:DUF4832 domain-containing protein [Ignavibacteriota bacterium]
MKKFILIVLLISNKILFAQYNLVNYDYSNEDFANPERGFYSHFEVQSEGSSLSISQLQNVRSDKQSLILRIYYLKNFKDKLLSDKQLNLIKNDFKIMRDAGIKCILRFAYSQDIGQTDAPLNIVLSHLDQLKEILEDNYDVIAFFQAGFIGAWGEWHSSTNNLDNVNSRREIVNKILSVLPSERMIQLRTPLFKREIFERQTSIEYSEAFNESNFSRTGHHNDCFLANYDDYSTYQDTTEEKKYLNDECLFTPMGGETCNPSEFSECGNSLSELKRLRWTYLNDGYHPSVISGWQSDGCLPEIKLKLGYRFQLLQGEFKQNVKLGNTFELKLILQNIGFASLYNPRNVEIVLENNQTQKKYFSKLPIDPRFWQPDSIITIEEIIGVPENMEMGDYKIYLNMPDPIDQLHDRVEYSIRFANQNIWESTTGYNNLNSIVNINDTSSGNIYNGDFIFSEVNNPTSIENIFEDGKQSENFITNYPNPFNSSTRIKFFIKEPANVNLKLFNSIGEEIDTIVNDYLSAGWYEKNFDANKLSSGIYLFSLSTGDEMKCSKMLIMK